MPRQFTSLLSKQIGQIVGTSVNTAGLRQLYLLRLSVTLDDSPLPEKARPGH